MVDCFRIGCCDKDPKGKEYNPTLQIKYSSLSICFVALLSFLSEIRSICNVSKCFASSDKLLECTFNFVAFKE